MPNPRPDFAQFADQAASVEAVSAPIKWQDETGCHEFDLSQFMETAERHARLLETIQKWAESPINSSTLSVHNHSGFVQAKAHIRSLLEQG